MNTALAHQIQATLQRVPQFLVTLDATGTYVPAGTADQARPLSVVSVWSVPAEDFKNQEKTHELHNNS